MGAYLLYIYAAGALSITGPYKDLNTCQNVGYRATSILLYHSKGRESLGEVNFNCVPAKEA